MKVSVGLQQRLVSDKTINVVFTVDEAKALRHWFDEYAPVTEAGRVTKNEFKAQLMSAILEAEAG